MPKLSGSGSRCRRAFIWSPSTTSPDLVTESIHSVRDAILIGVILASLIMVLFLRDWGTSVVAVLVIPVTVVITFIALKLLDQSFNLMTLGGLAAAVGLVIDDAIVVVENVALHRDAGQGRLRGDPERAARDHGSADRIDDYADRGLSAAHRDHRRHRRVLSRAGDHGGRVAADVAGPRAHLDAHAEPVLDSRRHTPKRHRVTILTQTRRN